MSEIKDKTIDELEVMRKPIAVQIETHQARRRELKDIAAATQVELENIRKEMTVLQTEIQPIVNWIARKKKRAETKGGAQ